MSSILVHPEYILIDNDFLIRKSWEMAAAAADINLRTYSSVNEFLANPISLSLSKDCLIYIDLELDGGVRGDIEAKKLYELGHNNLYLATGHPANSLNKPHYIIEITGKRPPF